MTAIVQSITTTAVPAMENEENLTLMGVLVNKFTNAEIIIYRIFFSLILIFGVLFNIILLYLYFKNKKIRDSIIIFIIFMTFNDLFIEIWEGSQQIYITFVRIDDLPVPLCVLVHAIGIAAYGQSFDFLLLTYIYRYKKINNPFEYEKELTTKKSTIIIFLNFLFGVFLSLYPVFISVLDYNGHGSCKGYYNFKNKYFPILILTVVPITIGIIIFHIKTIRIAKKHVDQIERQIKQLKNISTSSKANLIPLFLQFILWSIFGLVIIMFLLNSNYIQTQKMIVGISHLLLAHTLFNPIFTIFGNRSVKLAFFELFNFKFSKILPN